MTGLGRQAKLLSDAQLRATLLHVGGRRNPERDRLMVLLSAKAGLRAKEIAGLTWGMVTDSAGALAADIALENTASKGKRGGRIIPMHPEIAAALQAYLDALPDDPLTGAPIIRPERADKPERGMPAHSIVCWFKRLYADLGFDGCSSHSGRRTFITQAARKIGQAGGSIRDVQALAGHSSLSVTQRYIESDSEAQRKVIKLL